MMVLNYGKLNKSISYHPKNNYSKIRSEKIGNNKHFIRTNTNEVYQNNFYFNVSERNRLIPRG